MLKASVRTLDQQHEQTIENAEKASSKNKRDSLFQLLKQSSENIKDMRSNLNIKQEALAKLMSKKPKVV